MRFSSILTKVLIRNWNTHVVPEERRPPLRVDGQSEGGEDGGAALLHVAQVVEQRGDAVAAARLGAVAATQEAGPEVVPVRLVLSTHAVGHDLK